MGIDVARVDFSAQDFDRFSDRLRDELALMRELLAKPGFGEGARSLGAELELHLVGSDMRPAPMNEAVVESSGDSRATLELNQYNLEFNANPGPLAGTPFATMRGEFEEGLGILRTAAEKHGCQIAMVGTLPTLRAGDLSADCITPRKRYHALSQQLRWLRGEAFEVRVNGQDSLLMRAEEVALEGACTSWQLHMRVSPDDFASHYNAAQLATSVVLAVSGNSPLFVGHRLWEETRVALFKQAVDPRADLSGDWHRLPRVCLGSGWVRKGALELFEESVALHEPLLPICGHEDGPEVAGSPLLESLRLHHGTVWSWNRAVFDPVKGSDDAHLRIELRAMAAGPTLTDMLANSAYALGLTLGLAADADRWMPRMPFEHARHNFYRGAQHGLNASLLWPAEKAPSPALRDARELALSLLPVAARGLESAGVEHADYAPLLEIIEARVKSGQTGAAWQRKTFSAYGESNPSDRALALMLEDYLRLSLADAPVHEW
jgi:gamma-glutamyl:cysteine ligase YbdK (ATP-grasp superfamily)